MRIALIHSFYRSETPSGENSVVMSQAEALTAAGHDVLLVARHTDEESRQALYSARAALRVTTGFGPDPTAELRAFRPDVVHVHNLFPNFGDRWVTNWRGPLLVTLHNFRPLCANGLLYRGGQVCTDCLSSGAWNAVRHRCYHDSLLASVPLAVHTAGGPSRNRLLTRADRVIVLSHRSRQVFAQAGSARLAGKLIVLPNGVEDRGGNISATRTHWAFVGRLTREKGIGELLEVWPADEPLIVAGDGELRNHLERIAPSSVRFAGVLDQARVDDVLKSAWSLVLPSRWYEGFPTVVGEALMHGTPVIARDGSSGADFVEAMGVGSVYSDVPFEAMKAIAAEYPRLSRRSRHVYVERLSREAWTELLHQLYVQLAEEFHRAVGQRNC